MLKWYNTRGNGNTHTIGEICRCNFRVVAKIYDNGGGQNKIL